MGRRVLHFIWAAAGALIAGAAPARADVVAAYELVDSSGPGDVVVDVVQGGPGRRLIITLDDEPGAYTLVIRFVADVEPETALFGYAVELPAPTADTVEAVDFEYLGLFEMNFPPILAAGPGSILDEAAEFGFSDPLSGLLELFDVTLVVTVPTQEVELFSKIGDFEWGSIGPDPFTITFADSEPLLNSPPSPDEAVSSTPSIVIRVTTDEPPMADCNGNGMDDAAEIAANFALDCDNSGVPDSCQIAAGAPDCDGDGTLDACEVAAGAADCNRNGVPDDCDIAAGAVDCDGNGVPDVCQIGADAAADCDGDGVLDSCELALGDADCNSNGVPDDCDIDRGPSADVNANRVPDECENLGPPAPQEQTGPGVRVVDRASLRRWLAVVFGISGEGGISLAALPVYFYGGYGIPMSIAVGIMELSNLPLRVAMFELTFMLLDAFLP